ncbi:MAG: apolipoprotein N-acyltransferase, partial [Pseudomonadota bacterium]
SAVINARGRVISSLPYRQAGAIMTNLPAADAPTLFARFGNRLALGLAFLLVIGAIATRRALR